GLIQPEAIGSAVQETTFSQAAPALSARQIDKAWRMSLSSTATATANPWVRILSALEKKINRHSFETWLKPTRFSHAEGELLIVRVPTAEFRNIGEKYADLIQEAIDGLDLGYHDVKYMTQEQLA